MAHYDRRRYDDAIALISRAIELSPREPSAYNHLGLALLATHQLERAARQFEKAIGLRPGHRDARVNLANALKKLKRFEPAEALLRELIADDPSDVAARHNLGLLLFERKRFEEAQRELLAVLRIAPDFHKTQHLLGQAAENLGHFDDAAARYESVLRQVPGHHPAMTALLGLRNHEVDAALIEKAERLAAREDAPEREAYTLCFGLAKRFERQGRYDRAFHYLRLANERRKRRRPYDAAKVEQWVSGYVVTFDRELIQRHAAQANQSERPVFIVGMPRTGTTLTEQILAAHPRIHGAGELPDLPEATASLAAMVREGEGRTVPPYPSCLRSVQPQMLDAAALRYLDVIARQGGEALRVIDKNPFNYINVGLIAMLFPRARIIHCRRDPMDVALSCYTELFELRQDFTTDFNCFAHYYAQYLRLMGHWRAVVDVPMLEVSYERLVQEPELTIRGLVEFCGVEWDAACLSFQQTERPVLTPSKWQVRQPLYTTSVGRWRQYERHLEPLRQALQKHGVADG